ncbi:hypothetical protein KJ885_03465 [Patescibacteria group bacterium]|nr:hypothetical protein [Patescibacteria group bacterium]
MTTKVVADEVLGRLARKHHDLFRRVREGTLNATRVLNALQDIIEGRFGTVISIDRSKPFSPAEFIGEGWSIWKGPADGDGLTGVENQDARSLILTEVDTSAIRLETRLRDGETRITGEEKLRRLKATKHIRLDAKVFQTFWENKHFIPESWKSGSLFIYFDGTPLRDPNGKRCVLCLHWLHNRWFRGHLLDVSWLTNSLSAVLAK